MTPSPVLRTHVNKKRGQAGVGEERRRREGDEGAGPEKNKEIVLHAASAINIHES